MFVLSFKNGDDDPTRNYFDEYYMSLVELRDFNALIENKPFLISQWKTNKKRIKNVSKFQEIMIIQQEIYYVICFFKNIINSLLLTYQDRQIQVFLDKLILQEN